MSELWIGTCSWRYPSWHGLVYSSPRGINYLEEYSGHYKTVEIDRWFWSLFGPGQIGLPDPLDAQRYRDAVPDDFRFTVKAPNSITLTHAYRKSKNEALQANPYFLSPWLLKQFLAGIAPLHDVLGPIMFQFEYLNRKKMDSQERFHASLSEFALRLPADKRFAVEVRNPKYLNPSFFALLGERKLIPVLLQGYWMPPIAQIYEEHRSLIADHDTAIIRLLGPDRKGIEEATGKRWNRLVEPRDRELSEVADVVRDLLGRGVRVYVNVNNHYEGSAPLTIQRFRRMLPGIDAGSEA
jgi:uncharacterized protein YecE (DUF72 family)